MRKSPLGLVIAIIGLFFFSPANAVDLEAAMKERVLGDPNAPVTLIEYSSLGCPHCASFHADSLPLIKQNYIDTGKVKLVMRDFPLGGAAFAASMLARCVPEERFFGMIETIFKTQNQWGRSENPRASLINIARLAGLSTEDANACLESRELYGALQNQAKNGQAEHGVNSTPTFIIDGEKIVGAEDYEVFAEAIDDALAKKN
ncbi:MAG: DsbA family protein [Magnetovibrionaceae bacterium]